jgi:outer membrane biosynthesis protein TonB
MQTPGLSAGHNSLPIGSKARIRSLSNGKEIEVTITEYIPTSTRRIIDLSPSAALALELGFGGPVIVTPLAAPQGQTASQPQQITDTTSPQTIAVEPAPEPVMAFIPEPEPMFSPEPMLSFAPDPEPEPIPAFDPEPEPIAMYIPEPAPQPQPAPQPAPPPPQPAPPQPQPAPQPPPPQPQQQPSSATTTIIIITNPDDLQRLQQRGVIPSNLGGEMPYSSAQSGPGGTPSYSTSTYTNPPVSINNMQITPDLPNPLSGKIYRLRVGNDSSVENAPLVSQQLMKAGFQVVQEQAGALFRVYVVGIPASSVYYAVQRLGAIGFGQVGIYEQ